MLVLPDQLTHRQATACLNMLLRGARAETGAQVLLDATPLVRFDSAALAVLLALRRACRRVDKPLVIRGLPAKLRELAGLYGVDTLLVAVDEAGGAAPTTAANQSA